MVSIHREVYGATSPILFFIHPTIILYKEHSQERMIRMEFEHEKDKGNYIATDRTTESYPTIQYNVPFYTHSPDIFYDSLGDSPIDNEESSDGVLVFKRDLLGLLDSYIHTIPDYNQHIIQTIRNSIALMPSAVNGSTSDGYHTFDELYEHRTVLFSVICNSHTDLAWKSRHHHDGTMFDDMFVAGIRTPAGPCTYHCENQYWDLFRVPELERAPEFDGHTPEDVLQRIQSL